MRRFLKYWPPLLIWLGVMFVGSTNLMSSGAHVALYCSVFALGEPGDIPGHNVDYSRRRPQMRARHRICDSGFSAVARASQFSGSPDQSGNVFWRSSAGLRTFCHERRISPDIRQIAHAVGPRCLPGYCGSPRRIVDWDEFHTRRSQKELAHRPAAVHGCAIMTLAGVRVALVAPV